MNGGTEKAGLWRVRTVAQQEAAAPEAPATADDLPIFADHHYEDGPPALSGGRPWIAITAATVLALCWIGWFGWAIFAEPRGLQVDPATFAQWIATASAPLALIGVAYLLFQRNSRVEARRFGRTATALRAESAALEATLARITARLEDNRASLAVHVTDLVARGDDAARSLAGINTAIEAEGEAIARHSASLKTSAAAARGDLSVLLASLPAAHAQTQEMAASLQQAGLDANQSAHALEAQLSALIARSREADDVASGAAQRLGAHLSRIAATSDIAGTRMDAAAGQMTEAVDAALTRAADAMEAARQGMDAQAEAMRALVERSRLAIDRTGVDSGAALEQRLADMTARVEQFGAAIERQDAAGRAMLENLAREMGTVDSQLSRLDETGRERTDRLSHALSGVQGDAERARAAFEAGGATADEFTARVEALLVALDASAREMDETLPAAFNRMDDHARQSKSTIGSVAPDVERLDAVTATALERLSEARSLITGQHDTIAALIDTIGNSIDDSRNRIRGLDDAIGETDTRARGFAEQAGPLLLEALLRVRETATQAAEKARIALENAIPDAADRLGNEMAESMRRTLADRVQAQLSDIMAAAEQAVGAAQQASERLSHQVLAIGESSALLETRINDAASHDNFARRVALLIESLNSIAIDVTKMLSNDVTDSAWASYLKGDRGIFTRRAVRLLDTGDVRSIARHYDGDPEFREQVNRYIHDFEAMLRTVLATRDGSPLGVTLLSSDNGKLYVALAQAIERLR